MKKKYIGCKIIVGEPMTKAEWWLYKLETEPDDKLQHELASKSIQAKYEHGYKVTYPDGYVSWSPKAAFENAYREISEGEMNLIQTK